MSRPIPYLLFATALLFSQSCHNAAPLASEDGGTTYDTSSQDDTESTGDPDPLDMVCDGDHLFDYGLETRELYEEGPDCFYLTEIWDYEYDGIKRPTWAHVHHYENDLPSISYNRHYEWGVYDTLEWIEWTYKYYDGSSEMHALDILFYDEEERLEIHEEWRGAYDLEIQWYDERKYSTTGQLATYYSGASTTSPHTFGESYQYDWQGRLIARTELDHQDKWVLSENIVDYTYDSWGRVSRTLHVTVDDETGADSELQVVYSYDGDTGRLVSHLGSNGHETTYGWNGMVLTIIDEYPTGARKKRVHKFTKGGSSRYFQVAPIPPATWPIYIYGSGYINGCLGM